MPTTYRVPVYFRPEPGKNDLASIYDALGPNARHEMTITGGEPTSEGSDPTYFYLVIRDSQAVGVDTPDVTGERAAGAVMAQALLDNGYTVETARVAYDQITAAN